jgi:hypothetical protein
MSPPIAARIVVHQMVLTLKACRLHPTTARSRRSIEVLPDPTALPRLQILRAEVWVTSDPLGRTKLAPAQMTWKTYNKMMIGMGMPTAHRSMPRIIEFSSACDAPGALLPV